MQNFLTLMAINVLNMFIRSLDGTLKILGKFSKMLKIGDGEDFQISERISTLVSF